MSVDLSGTATFSFTALSSVFFTADEGELAKTFGRWFRRAISTSGRVLRGGVSVALSAQQLLLKHEFIGRVVDRPSLEATQKTLTEQQTSLYIRD